MFSLRIIDREHKADINIKNEPFKLFGRMIPSYTNEKWSYEVEHLPEGEVTEMCFPDENYDYDELAKNHVFVGAYDDEKCIGLAILRHEWHKFSYLGYGLGKLELHNSSNIRHSDGLLFFTDSLNGCSATGACKITDVIDESKCYFLCDD